MVGKYYFGIPLEQTTSKKLQTRRLKVFVRLSPLVIGYYYFGTPPEQTTFLTVYVEKIEEIKDLHIMCTIKTITKQEKTASKRGRFLYIKFDYSVV